MLSRRLLILAPALLLGAARPVLTLEATDSRRREAFLAWPGGAVFTCPARGAALVAVLGMGPLAALEPVAVIGFATAAGQDWLAFVDAQARLLALEPHNWRGPDGESLTTLVAMLPDRRNITLQRSAARHSVVWRRETWTDYLRAENGALVDAPPRPVLAGTWQHTLAARRAALAALLRPTRKSITPDLLATLAAASPLAE